MELVTKRFFLRPLTVADVSERYLSWMRDESAQKYIVASSRTRELSDLEAYVAARQGRDDVLFLGIFERETSAHIGNIKFEPVNSDCGFAVMGILVGEGRFRGQGVAAEVLQACAGWLRAKRDIKEILLGVERDNHRAIRAYEKVGFVVEDSEHLDKVATGCLTMIWRI